jgi:hypothetical protein
MGPSARWFRSSGPMVRNVPPTEPANALRVRARQRSCGVDERCVRADRGPRQGGRRRATPDADGLVPGPRPTPAVRLPAPPSNVRPRPKVSCTDGSDLSPREPSARARAHDGAPSRARGPPLAPGRHRLACCDASRCRGHDCAIPQQTPSSPPARPPTARRSARRRVRPPGRRPDESDSLPSENDRCSQYTLRGSTAPTQPQLQDATAVSADVSGLGP